MNFRSLAGMRAGGLCIALACLCPVIAGIAAYLTGGMEAFDKVPGPALFGVPNRPSVASFGWLDRGVQTRAESFVSERLPLRNWMIRAGHQLDYSLLRTSRMLDGHIVIGRDGVLFESGYIRQAFGYQPVLDDSVHHALARRLNELNGRLARHGVALIVLGSPNKVSFMRADVPGWFPDRHAERERNYARMAKAFAEAGVPFVDGKAEMKASLLQQKAHFFPKGASPWNPLGAYAAISRRLTSLLADATPGTAPVVVLDKVSIAQPAADGDAALLMLLNLLFPDTSYGSVQVAAHLQGKQLPRGITLVGTSFIISLHAVLDQAKVAPQVLRLEDMRLLAKCAACPNEPRPVTWANQILDNSSALVLEINEGVGYWPGNYVDEMIDGLTRTLLIDGGQTKSN